MKVLIETLAIFCITITGSCKKSGDGGAYTPPVVHTTPGPVDQHWTFETTPSFVDSFNYNGVPDPNKWTYDLGGSGWGNHELEYYTNAPANSHADGTNLNITAIKENVGGMNYTSARLISKGAGDFLYGRIEVSAKLPAGRGTWPAIWMLPTDWAYGSWPNSGEIDIMEHVGFDPNNIHFSIHTQSYNWTINTQKTTTVNIPTSLTDFHKYRIDWTPYAIRAYYDDNLVYTFVNEGSGSAVWPFDKRFHLMLNLAIGGDWGNQQGVDDTIFPCSMLIDYVKVYKMIQ